MLAATKLELLVASQNMHGLHAASKVEPLVLASSI